MNTPAVNIATSNIERKQRVSRSALIMAAGTGGHIMPGLAIASQLQSHGWSVQWLGTTHGMENKLVPGAGLVLNKLTFAGLRGKGVLGAVKGAWQLLIAFLNAVKILNRVKPNVVVGMGGYVCVPGAWAARVRGIPLILVNADADVLLSNRSLAGFAQVVCCGFDGGAAKLPRAVVTGNPVRNNITHIDKPASRYSPRKGALNILVVGGSLGAQVLNQLVPEALALIPSNQRPTVQHQTGIKQLEQVRASYAVTGLVANCQPFIDDMAAAYAWADLVVCRAGAITVSELCAAGVPAILVPLIVSTTAHQAGNAQFMADAGAGIHLPQLQLTPQVLADIVQQLSRDKLLMMAQAAQRLGKPHATLTVVQHIEQAAL